MLSTSLSDLKNAHYVFWWEAMTLNITLLVYKKTPQGTVTFCLDKKSILENIFNVYDDIHYGLLILRC